MDLTKCEYHTHRGHVRDGHHGRRDHHGHHVHHDRRDHHGHHGHRALRACLHRDGCHGNHDVIGHHGHHHGIILHAQLQQARQLQSL